MYIICSSDVKVFYSSAVGIFFEFGEGTATTSSHEVPSKLPPRGTILRFGISRLAEITFVGVYFGHSRIVILCILDIPVRAIKRH